MKEATSALSATVLVSKFPRQQNLALVWILVFAVVVVLLLDVVVCYSVLVLTMCCFVFVPTADPPRVTTHPKGLEDVVPGQTVTLPVQAEGTEPLSYQWKQRPRGRSEGWQVCDGESFEGADSSKLTILSVQKSNEGSYHCTVSNCADIETSDSASLTLGELKYHTCDWALAATTIYTRWWVESYLCIPSHKFGARKGCASYLLIQQAPPPGTQMFPSTEVLLPVAK